MASSPTIAITRLSSCPGSNTDTTDIKAIDNANLNLIKGPVFHSNGVRFAFIPAGQIGLTLCGNWMIVPRVRLSQRDTLVSACGQFSLPRGQVRDALRASRECPEGRDSVPKVVCWNCCRHPAATNFLWDRAISVSSAENVVFFIRLEHWIQSHITGCPQFVGSLTSTQKPSKETHALVPS